MHKNDRNLLRVVGLDEIKTFALRIVHRVDQSRVLEKLWIRIIRQRSAEVGGQSTLLVHDERAIALRGIGQRETYIDSSRELSSRSK